MSGATVDGLGTAGLFRDFTKRDLEALAAITVEVTRARGDVLCEQGRVADGCWVVLEGEAEVEIGDGQLVGVVGPGETVGEMGLLDHLPRSATVRARTDMRLLFIDAGRFDGLLGSSPLARGFLELMSRRVRELQHGRAHLA